MNIERGITYMALLIMALIVLAYAFGLQNRVSFLPFGKQAQVAIPTSHISAEATRKGEVADLQALAEYQATLSTYPVNPNRAANISDKPVEQIADLQALAAYQASLPALVIPKTAQSRKRPADQITNLQELAQYHETYVHYYVDVTSRQ